MEELKNIKEKISADLLDNQDEIKKLRKLNLLIKGTSNSEDLHCYFNEEDNADKNRLIKITSDHNEESENKFKLSIDQVSQQRSLENELNNKNTDQDQQIDNLNDKDENYLKLKNLNKLSVMYIQNPKVFII